MRLSAAATSLLTILPSLSEGKLGAPRHKEQHQHPKHLPQNIDIGGPHLHDHPRRSLETSCYEHPGQFRYQTQTNGDVLISCSRLVLQVARGVVSSSNISKKCTQPLVGDYRYGPGATVADACPALCGRPCDDQYTATFEEQNSPDLVSGVVVVTNNEEDNNNDYGGDVVRLPENDSNEDVIIEDELDIEVEEEYAEQEKEDEQLEGIIIETIEPNPIVDTDDESVDKEQQQQEATDKPHVEEQPTPVVYEESPSIIETIQSQVQQELTESEDEEYGDTTPTIELIAESEDDKNKEEDEEEEEDEVDTQIDRPTPTIATFGKFSYLFAAVHGNVNVFVSTSAPPMLTAYSLINH
jgi:hypothetical protein